jgi:HSP20 family molecular chaperone IbpA
MKLPWTKGRVSPRSRFRRLRYRITRFTRPAPRPEPRTLLLPELHVYETPTSLSIRVETHDLDPSRIQIRMTGYSLTLTSLVRDEGAVRPYRRSIVLPGSVDRSGIVARFKGKVLVIRAPKRPGASGLPRAEAL